MKASGNGDVNVCVANLLRTFRGEVPYERVKGLDPRLIDRPSRDAEIEAQQDATWLIEADDRRIQLCAVRFDEVKIRHAYSSLSVMSA